MIEFEALKFRYTFRDYQKRALDEIHKYMADDKIHIVAAPGAGKTILALQLLIECRQNTLILVPTIALREQWIERFKEDFAKGADVSSYVSDDLKIMKPITVTTYQALHSFCKEDAKKVLADLQAANIQMIVLDEAHHLKASWWSSLQALIKELEQVKLISLTATPPYDVQNSEWMKYMNLCGEIDAEILIPELVKEENLCPHQDYIYFNYPSKEQIKEIDSYQEKRRQFFNQLCENPNLATAISLHPGIINLDTYIDYFLNHFDYFLSLCSFLKYKGIPFHPFNDKMDMQIPSFDLYRMEILLTHCLFSDKNAYLDFADFFRDVKRRLNELGAIQDSKVYLLNDKETKTIITQNIGKLQSIHAIVASELQAMKDRLKLVVMTDYIREDIYDVKEDTAINVIGAVPIFKSLRNQFPQGVNLVVLTGNLVIIPSQLTSALQNIYREKDNSAIEILELGFDFDYSRVLVNDRNRKNIVSVITKLFEQNHVHVLIGTAALLGEGWDAPFVNALIMATFISSYVTSNQIRGRAIRTNKAETNKTANIWHLVCLEREGPERYKLGLDFDSLKRRFETFEGIHMDEDKISRGIERMAISEKTYLNQATIENLNASMQQAAANRESMARRWTSALTTYLPILRTKVLEADYEICMHSTQKANLQVGLLEAGIFSLIGGSLLVMLGVAVPIILLSIAGIIALVGTNRFIGSRRTQIVKKFGKALMTTLVEIGMIERESKVIIEKEKKRISFFMLEGTTMEKSRFNSCLKEMISEIGVPRYLIKIKNVFYPVPQMLGKNKAWVQILEKNLKKTFGRTQSIYTKTPAGKRKLLEIKMQGR